MGWQEILRRVDSEIQIGTPILNTKGGNRPVTKKVDSRIYMRTGKNTRAEKYATKEMVRYAYETMESGKPFTSADLRSKFPKEWSHGHCVFSMTGGILEKLGIARYIGRGKGYISVSLFNRR